MQYAVLNRCARPRYQLLLMAVVATIMAGLMYVPFAQFHTNDPMPAVQPVNSAGKAVVKTGLVLRNFMTFDVIKNQFDAELVVWFAFDEKQIALADIGAFTLSKADIEKSEPVVTKEGALTFARYAVRAHFSSNLDHHDFPLADHRIYLTITNPVLSTNNIVFVADESTFVVAESLYTFGWQAMGKQVQAGQTTLSFDTHNQHPAVSVPRVLYALGFKQASVRLVTLVVIPLLLTLFLSLLVFAIDSREYYTEMVAVSVASASAMIAYRYTINDISPEVPYFMVSDYLFGLLLVLAFSVSMMIAFYRQYLPRISGLIVLTIHAVLLIVWTVLMYSCWY